MNQNQVTPFALQFLKQRRLRPGKASLIGLMLLGACASKTAPPAQQPYPQQPYPQQPYPGYPGQTQQQQPYPQNPGYPGQAQQQPNPQNPAPQTPPQVSLPPVTQPVPPAAAGADPITSHSLAFFRSTAQQVLVELVRALPAGKRERIEGIPLIVDDTPGDVNAFAACTKTGAAAMAITDGLLQIEGVLSQAQAHDELFGTRKVDEYVSFTASRLQPGKPIPLPPAGFLPYELDGRVVARQHQVFEEQVAFVLGHELGHHHLGHLPCTAKADGIGAGDAARILSDVIPAFNQPNELAADLAGTQNILDAGKARATRGLYAWTENGGLLTMRFFAGFSQLTPGSILTSFERSHPAPQLRQPIIQQAARNWRSGGQAFPIPGFGF